MKTLVASTFICILLVQPTFAKNKKIKPVSQDSSSQVQDEIKQIENNINNTPSTTLKSVGPFDVKTSKGNNAGILPDISVLGSLVGGYFNNDPAGDVGHDPARTGFTLQEIELALQSVVDPYFRADLFLSFHEDGVELEEGTVSTLALVKGLQIKAGQLLIPVGRQNQKHLHTWSFVDNTLANKYLLGVEGLRELGVEIAYTFPTPFFLQLQGTFSNGDNDTSFGGTRKQDFLYQTRISTGFDLSNKTSVLLGASGAWGFNNSGLGQQTHLYGGDIYFRYKPSSYRSVSWQSEYLFRDMQVAGTTVRNGAFYSYMDWQFAKRWHVGLRYDQTGVPEATVMREYRISPALTFNPTEFSRLRLQYEYDKVKGADPVHAIFLQLQFAMGVHSAHQY